MAINGRCEQAAAKALEEGFLHWCEEVAILFPQLAHGPTDMHAGTNGEAGVVDTRHEIWHVVRVRWGGFGDLGECGTADPAIAKKQQSVCLAWLAAGADTGGAVVSVAGTRSYSQRATAPQRLHGPPTPAGIWSASSRTSWAQPGQSHAGRHAAMPAPISRCGKGTKSTPPACPMAASRWQHNTAIPGGGGGSGASLEVNVRRL